MPSTTSPEVLAFIKETFALDGEQILRKGKPVRHRPGAEKASYVKVHIGRFDGKQVKWKRSRLKVYLATGELPPTVDHESGRTRDDSLGNLRPASFSQNNSNKRVKRNKRGGLPRGIDQPRGPTGPYRVRIGYNKRQHNVGAFRTCEEAVAARNAAEKPLKGAFHRPRRKHGAKRDTPSRSR